MAMEQAVHGTEGPTSLLDDYLLILLEEVGVGWAVGYRSYDLVTGGLRTGGGLELEVYTTETKMKA
jgi:hypothetical protein